MAPQPLRELRQRVVRYEQVRRPRPRRAVAGGGKEAGELGGLARRQDARPVEVLEGQLRRN